MRIRIRLLCFTLVSAFMVCSIASGSDGWVGVAGSSPESSEDSFAQSETVPMKSYSPMSVQGATHRTPSNHTQAQRAVPMSRPACVVKQTQPHPSRVGRSPGRHYVQQYPVLNEPAMQQAGVPVGYRVLPNGQLVREQPRGSDPISSLMSGIANMQQNQKERFQAWQQEQEAAKLRAKEERLAQLKHQEKMRNLRYRQVAQNGNPYLSEQYVAADKPGLLDQLIPPRSIAPVAANSYPLVAAPLPRGVERDQRIVPAHQLTVSNTPRIDQVTYRPTPTQAPVRSIDQVSPDLYQPWDLEQFTQPARSSSGNLYRLVSDSNSANQPKRTPPPSMRGDQLVARPEQTASTHQAQPAARSVQVQTNRNVGAQNTSTREEQMAQWKERMPLLFVGQDLVNEWRPSNNRKWSQNHAVLQTAQFNGRNVTVNNVRYSKYDGNGGYSTIYYDATFNLDEIQSFDLVVVPFHAMPSLAHVQGSFGFADGRHIALSIEARYEEGEQYDPLGAGMRQFELIYVFADERDLIRIGTDVNKNDVHIYRLRLDRSEVREIFVDALQRANQLAEKPEFYHPLRNSCVTNLVNHINKGRPKAIPREYRTLLPGLMDSYVYDLKLVDTTAATFKEAKENAKVNWLVDKYGDLEYFSAGIRQNMH